MSEGSVGLLVSAVAALMKWTSRAQMAGKVVQQSRCTRALVDAQAASLDLGHVNVAQRLDDVLAVVEAGGGEVGASAVIELVLVTVDALTGWVEHLAEPVESRDEYWTMDLSGVDTALGAWLPESAAESPTTAIETAVVPAAVESSEVTPADETEPAGVLAGESSVPDAPGEAPVDPSPTDGPVGEGLAPVFLGSRPPTSLPAAPRSPRPAPVSKPATMAPARPRERPAIEESAAPLADEDLPLLPPEPVARLREFSPPTPPRRPDASPVGTAADPPVEPTPMITEERTAPPTAPVDPDTLPPALTLVDAVESDPTQAPADNDDADALETLDPAPEPAPPDTAAPDVGPAPATGDPADASAEPDSDDAGTTPVDPTPAITRVAKRGPALRRGGLPGMARPGGAITGTGRVEAPTTIKERRLGRAAAEEAAAAKRQREAKAREAARAEAREASRAAAKAGPRRTPPKHDPEAMPPRRPLHAAGPSRPARTDVVPKQPSTWAEPVGPVGFDPDSPATRHTAEPVRPIPPAASPPEGGSQRPALEDDELDRLRRGLSRLIRLHGERAGDMTSEELRRAERELQQLHHLVDGVERTRLSELRDGWQAAIEFSARQQGKRVALDVRGADLWLRGDLATRLDEAVRLLLDNAVRHGTQPPNERVARGRDPTALLKVELTKGFGLILATITDEGVGLDRQAMLAEVTQRIGPEASSYNWLPNQELWRLHAGRLAHGRGRTPNGWERVRRIVTSRGGHLWIDPRHRSGLRIQIGLAPERRLVRALTLKQGIESAILPVDGVVGVRDLRGGLRRRTRGWIVIGHGEDLLPAVRLHEESGLLGLSTKPPPAERQAMKDDGPLQLVVLAHAGRRIGIICERVEGPDEVFAEPAGRVWGRRPEIAGFSLASGGQPVPLLNPLRLLSLAPSSLSLREARLPRANTPTGPGFDLQHLA